MKILLPIIVISLCLCSGCVTLNDRYSYAMVMVNLGSEDMHSLHLRSLETDWEFFGPHSILIPFAQSVHAGPIPAPPNGRFIYSWRDADGHDYREEVDMSDRVSRFFRGEIVFIVDGDNNLKVETYRKRRTYRLPPRPR